MNRWRDRWDQASRDIKHAEHALDVADFEWSAFAALPESVTPPAEVVDAARRLDKHYIPSRYPNGFDSGFPGKLYTRGEGEKAIEDAREIVEFLRRHLPG